MALDPSTQDFVTAALLNARKPRHLMSPEEARDSLAGLKGLLGPGAGLALRENRRLAVAGSEIELRLLRPEGELQNAIVYFHGGGWVVGSNDEFEPVCRNLAAQSGCTIVMVCFREVPPPFPILLEDAWTGVEWVAAQRRALFGSDLPLLLVGDGIGGNLMACVPLRERHRHDSMATAVTAATYNKRFRRSITASVPLAPEARAPRRTPRSPYSWPLLPPATSLARPLPWTAA